jgi:Peptidase propeptide and YPEB domain
MDRRLFVGLLGFIFLTLATPSFAKDGDGGNSGSGSNNSGSGNSGSGNDDGDDDESEDRDDDSDLRLDASAAVAQGEIAAVSKVIRIALERVPGKVISVRLKRESSTYMYRIKILTSQGRKREVYVDARSQRIFRVK